MLSYFCIYTPYPLDSYPRRPAKQRYKYEYILPYQKLQAINFAFVTNCKMLVLGRNYSL